MRAIEAALLASLIICFGQIEAMIILESLRQFADYLAKRLLSVP